MTLTRPPLASTLSPRERAERNEEMPPSPPSKRAKRKRRCDPVFRGEGAPTQSGRERG
jgi:hypothetical protein